MNLKRWSILFLFIALALGGGVLYQKKRIAPEPPLSLPEPQPFVQSVPSPSASPEPPKEVPAKFLLQIPFTSQAPTGNWDEMHNEACEEASALMAAAYFSGDIRKTLPASEVEKQLTDLTKWEEKRFGYSLDTTAEETAEMIRSVYHLRADLAHDLTEKDIREALLESKVVIIPVNGRKLGNPYFRQPGPIYHMLVIRGYTPTALVTNDSGTKHGENYPYSFAIIRNAVADWNHATGTIDERKSVMIVVSK